LEILSSQKTKHGWFHFAAWREEEKAQIWITSDGLIRQVDALEIHLLSDEISRYRWTQLASEKLRSVSKPMTFSRRRRGFMEMPFEKSRVDFSRALRFQFRDVKVVPCSLSQRKFWLQNIALGRASPRRLKMFAIGPLSSTNFDNSPTVQFFMRP
jgi:hypothetical protein